MQGFAHRLAPRPQLVDAELKIGDFIEHFGLFGFLPPPYALEFGFLVAALVEERFLLLRCEVASVPQGIALLLVPRHQGLEIGDFIGKFLFESRLADSHLEQFGGLLQPLHLLVDSGDLGLAPLELALRVEQVVDRRHEEIVMHRARQVAREGRQETQ